MSADPPTLDERPRRKHSHVLRQWLPLAGKRVADVGCGSGAVLPILAREGAWAIGIEPQAEQLIRGKRPQDEAALAGTISRLAARGEDLPLASECLDAALYFNALHHVPVELQAAALAEILRVLRPGGRLLVIEPLAEGPSFAVMQPVEDETDVRAAAQRALECAAETTAHWRLVCREEYTASVRYESFAAFRDGLVAVDPARAARVGELEAQLRRGFIAAAEADENGYRLEQPFRLHVMDRAAQRIAD